MRDFSEIARSIAAKAKYIEELGYEFATDPTEKAELLTIIRATLTHIGDDVKEAKKEETEQSTLVAQDLNDKRNGTTHLSDFEEPPKSTDLGDYETENPETEATVAPETEQKALPAGLEVEFIEEEDKGENQST